MQPGFEKLFSEAQRLALDQARIKEAAKLLLKLLSRRELALSEAQQHRILECSDLATVERWYDLAFSASSVDEIFARAKSD